MQIENVIEACRMWWFYLCIVYIVIDWKIVRKEKKEGKTLWKPIERPSALFVIQLKNSSLSLSIIVYITEWFVNPPLIIEVYIRTQMIIKGEFFPTVEYSVCIILQLNNIRTNIVN